MSVNNLSTKNLEPIKSRQERFFVAYWIVLIRFSLSYELLFLGFAIHSADTIILFELV